MFPLDFAIAIISHYARKQSLTYIIFAKVIAVSVQTSFFLEMSVYKKVAIRQFWGIYKHCDIDCNPIQVERVSVTSDKLLSDCGNFVKVYCGYKASGIPYGNGIQWARQTSGSLHGTHRGIQCLVQYSQILRIGG